MEKKKKAQGVNSIEQGFLSDPLLSPIQEVAAASYTVSPQELEKDMEAAGLEHPEVPEKKEVPVEETGVGQVETGYLNETALDVLAAASAMPGVSPHELKQQLGEVGIDVPEKPEKEKKEIPLEATGVGQVETGYLDASPLDVLAAASAMPGVSPHELKQQLGEVGIDVPEKPKKEKKPHEHHHSGVDSIEEGFLAEPELSIVEELGAIKYAAAPQEVEEDIEKVEETYKKPDGRLTPSEALLAKLREAGYTGDLEALKKLAEELK